MSEAVTPGAPPAATLLAAGLGRRLGGVPKSALRIGGQSVFERLVQALREAGIDDIRAVVGPYADVLLPLARRCGVRVVAQPQSDAPLVASQRLALHDHLRQSPGRDLMLLVADLPLLNSEHLVPLLQAWAQRPAGVQAQVPVVNGVRGHPVLLSWAAAQAVAAQPWPRGVREWWLGAGDAVQALRTGHDAHTTDLDTPDDLTALRQRLHPLPVAWPDGLVQPGRVDQALA